MKFSRFWGIAKKEAIQIRRDPRSMALAFALPMLLIVFFGYAISLDIDNVPIAVVDHAKTQQSQRLIDAFEASGYFNIVERPERIEDVTKLLDVGKVRAALIIPLDFTTGRSREEPPQVQLLLDGADANTATIVQNYADAITARYGAELLGASSIPGVNPDVRIWFNETLESTNMIVPGLIAVIMSVIAAMLTALTIAREWERGTMEQLASTPVTRSEVVLGKLLPYVGIGLFDVALAVIAGLLIFNVPLRGSILELTAFTMLFLVGVLGLGIFISAALKSQVLATQVSLVVTYLPALILSGFMFPIEGMPLILRIVTHIIPARYYITVTKGIFLKGIGVSILWPQALALVIFATVGLGLGLFAFKKRLA